MSAAVEALDSPGPTGWMVWLRRELAPFPGREITTLRLVISVVLVILISMTLQIPEAALSAYMVFFVTKENRVLTAVTGIAMIFAVTVAIAASLFLYRYTFDHPELRIPVMALTVFGGMYLSRVFVVGPLGFAIGFVVAVTQSAAELVPNGEALARALLWLWMAIVYPIALTVVLNQILFPASPGTALVRAVTHRLDAVCEALRETMNGNFAPKTNRAERLQLATRGNAQLFPLLHLAEMKDARLKSRHGAYVEAIQSSEHMVRAAAMLDLSARPSLSEDDRLCIKALLADIARVRGALQQSPQAVTLEKPAQLPAMLPELRELQLALASFHQSLTRETPAEAAPREAKKPLFVADALTNPAHARFALKVTLAAMACYFIYTGLNWPGIHTAFITCCFIALENTGATMRKGWLRLGGCAAGGLLGFLAIMYCIPHMESIVSLLLLTAVVSALAGWVAAGSERISYAGLQMAFAFFMCVFQGFAPATDFDTIRDRLMGIVLGIVVSAAVFRFIWPEDALASLRAILARVLHNLARLLLAPTRRTADKFEAEVEKDLDQALRFSELAAFETSDGLSPASTLSAALEDTARHAQAAYVVAASVSTAERSEGQQQAEGPPRTAIAKELDQAAICVESGSPCAVSGPASFGWPRALTQGPETDRLLLLRSIVERLSAIWRSNPCKR